MTPVRFFLAVCTFFLSVASVHAQPASRPRKIIVIDGRFFHEMPVATDKITKMHLLTTPFGASAVGFELSEPLPDAALQYAVPAGQIPEGASLLAQYDEAKPRAGAPRSLSPAKPCWKRGAGSPTFPPPTSTAGPGPVPTSPGRSWCSICGSPAAAPAGPRCRSCPVGRTRCPT